MSRRTGSTSGTPNEGLARGPIAALDALARDIARGILDSIPGGRARRERRLAVQRLEESEALLDSVVRRAGPGVTLSGHASGPTVDLLIRMAETYHQSQRLWIQTADEVLVFDLRKGRISRAVAEGGDLQGERVGELLVGMGLVSQDAIQKCLIHAELQQSPLGATLVERGLVTAEDLHEAIRQQSVLRLSRALLAQGAVYAMANIDEAEDDRCENVSIDPRELIEASSRAVQPED